jgi:PAS domain S-box-containing protein
MALRSRLLRCADLTQDARILYSSDSIVDILGHTPEEVSGRPCWDFFHPEEVPVARDFHSRGVKLDKAAVLAYCNLRNRQGQWVRCECCFSVVYNVMVVCTSIYRQGITSQRMATTFAWLVVADTKNRASCSGSHCPPPLFIFA